VPILKLNETLVNISHLNFFRTWVHKQFYLKHLLSLFSCLVYIESAAHKPSRSIVLLVRIDCAPSVNSLFVSYRWSCLYC